MKKILLSTILLLFVLETVIACGRVESDERHSLVTDVLETVADVKEIHEATQAETESETQMQETSSVNAYEDNNYVYKRELMNLSADDFSSYETGIIDITLPDGSRPDIRDVDDEGTMYTIYDTHDSFGISKDPIFFEIGRYSLKNQEYTPLITIENGNSYGFIVAVSPEYIVWKEVMEHDRGVTTCLHLYDQTTGRDAVFYDDPVDPETGNIYVLNYNYAVISDDKIFFDTMTGFAVDGTVEMDIFCFDITKESLTTVATKAKRPCRYPGGIAYLKKSADGNSDLYTCVDGVETFVMKLDDDTADYAFAGDVLCRSVSNYYEPDPEKMWVLSAGICYGEDCILSGKTTNYTYHILSNGSVMTWEITNPEKPVYYDITNDRFIRLADEEESYYGSYVGNGFVMFLCHVDIYDVSSPLQYVLISN